MSPAPASSTPTQDDAGHAAAVGSTPDRRGSALPSFAMITTKAMELRRRRGLMTALIVVYIGIPALFLGIRLLLHAFAPRTNQPAGNYVIFAVLVAGVLGTIGFIVAATAGCTAGSRDLTEGMFRHLVVTGRSRLALYLARIPAGLGLVMAVAAIGYTLICVVSVFAAPAFVSDSGVNIPPGLSPAGFEHWARDHANVVLCDLPDNSGPAPGGVACPNGPPWWSKSAVTPGHPAPASVENRAARFARQDYPRYAIIFRSPPLGLMIKGGLWVELEAAVGFTIGLGLASLMGQRTGPLILIIVFQLIVTPILAVLTIPHLQALQRSLVGLAMAHLEPAGLPVVLANPGGFAVGGGPGKHLLLPLSTTQAALVVVAWLAVWTILGGWRMRTREA